MGAQAGIVQMAEAAPVSVCASQLSPGFSVPGQQHVPNRGSIRAKLVPGSSAPGSCSLEQQHKHMGC